MTNFISVPVTALFVAAALTLPFFASAATYAYVNVAGEVRTVGAETPASAIATAPGISLHSGVILLATLTDGIVGDSVSGF